MFEWLERWANRSVLKVESFAPGMVIYEKAYVLKSTHSGILSVGVMNSMLRIRRVVRHLKA